MRADELLSQMDAKAAMFDFPVLDNAHWILAAARMRGFTSPAGIAITFEMLIYHTQAQAFLANVYAYGSLIRSETADVGAFAPLSESEDAPLWSDSGDWIVQQNRKILLNDYPLLVLSVGAPSGRIDMTDAEILLLADGDGCDEGTFLRAIVREAGIARVLPSGSITRLLPQLKGAQERIRLMNWDHPDVIAGEMPSRSAAIAQAARFLTGESETFGYDHSRDTVDLAIRGGWNGPMF